MQVAHFDTELQPEDFSWVRGTNRFLPADIAVQWAKPVPDEFHSRASATSRRYAYVLLESPVRPSLDAGRVGWVFRPIDGVAMEKAAAQLLGTHDFTSFRASECQARSPVKTMTDVKVSRRGSYWRIDFEADAFLHHMIRNIMGCLVAIGQGLRPPEWMRDVMDAKDRDAAAPTFAPDGLYFLGPVYDPRWGLPSRTAAYDWLP
jgi:tRNA pseudouridine38-40 synthase